MDLIRAARRKIVANPDVVALLGSDATWADGWVWQWKTYREIEGTQAASIVVSERSGWAAPNRHNTARFPRLQVEIYVDPIRDPNQFPNGNTPPTAHERAKAIWDQVDRIFHVPASQDMWWGADPPDPGVRVVASIRASEPEIVDVPDGDGAVRLTALYEVSLG